MEYTSPESRAFEISLANRETGLITLKSTVDRETHNEIALTVRAEDAGIPRLTSFAQVCQITL